MTHDEQNEAIKIAVRRLRRTRSADSDIQQLCDLLEQTFGRADPPRARLHKLWDKEPPELP